jgi:L-alanine-DL-glutamate epimerase-like enolase superfamily enzyme
MGQDEKTDIALVREGRKGLGDGADLLIDAGLVWDSKTALQRARAFSEYDIYWLEEPLRPDDYDGYRKLAEATEVRIAAGEEESGRQSFLDLMDRGRIDVVQVDLTRCGGFTEAMKIAALAWDRGLPVANHGFTTYINVTAALHWLNSIPNALICEFVAEEETNLRESLTKQKLRAVDGCLPIPQEPGLGIELDEDAINRFRVA